MSKPQKIIITGLPGSGKTTIARIIGEALGLPVIDTDSHCFDSNWNRKKEEEIFSIIERLVSGDHWILDGLYGNIADKFISKADAVIYIRINTVATLINLIRRKVRHLLHPKAHNYSGKRKLMVTKTIKTTFFKRLGSYKKWDGIIKNNKDSVEIITIHNTRKKTLSRIIDRIEKM